MSDKLILTLQSYLKIFEKRQISFSVRQQLFFFSSLINFLFIPLGIASPNEGSRYLLAKTIAENNSFSWPFNWVNQTIGFWFVPDFGIYQGFISDKAPGFSFVLVPFYLIGKILYLLLAGPYPIDSRLFNPYDEFIIYFLKLVLIVLAGYTTVRLYDLLNLITSNKKQNLVITILSTFATLFFLYTPSLFPSLLTGFLYLAIIYHLIKYDRECKLSDLIVAGVFSGYAVIVEYGTLVMLPWFLWYLLSKDLFISKKIRWKELLVYLGTSFIGIMPLFLYNMYFSGNPFQTAYFYSYWASQINFFHNLINGLSVLLFDVNKGLFIFNPILFLACLGFLNPRYYRRIIREVLLIVLPVCSFIVFYAKNFDPTGGAAVGPRYIIPIIPLMIIGLQGWFDIRNRFTFFLNSVMSFISFRNTILAVLEIGVNPGSMKENPIYSLAIPKFLNMHFNPILLRTNITLFWSLLIGIIAAIIILNFKQSFILFRYLFKNPNSNSSSINNDSLINESQSDIIITENQRKNIIYSSLWLFITFLIVFLTIGIQFLSRSSYPYQNWNQISDLAVIEICLILGGLATVWEYSSFNLKSFIRGA